MRKTLYKIHVILSVVLIIISLALFLCMYFSGISKTRADYRSRYEAALEMISNEGDYEEAVRILTELGNYQDSKKYITIANDWIYFQEAKSDLHNGNDDEAQKKFAELASRGNFKISVQAKIYTIIIELKLKIEEEKGERYNYGKQLFDEGHYYEAREIFGQLKGYKDSDSLLGECEIFVCRMQNAATVSTGTQISAGITENNKIVACGYEPLVNEIKKWENISSISVFGSLAIGLKMDGTVVTAGELDNDYRIETGNWDDIIAVSAGDLYIVGLRGNGTLVAQGYSGDGQMDIDDWTDIKSIDTGWRHTVGLTNSGEVKIAGLRYKDEELIKNDPEWHDIVAISAGGGYPGEPGEQGHTVGLRSDGKVLAVGDDGEGQCNFTNWKDKKIVAIAAGGFHTVGLTDDGKVVTTEDADSVVNDIKKWEEEGYVMVAIAAGYGTTFAIDTEGNVHSTGYYKDGQLETDNWGKLKLYKREWESVRPDFSNQQ